MIMKIDEVKMVALVEIFRASTSDEVRSLSWWATHRDEAEIYARKNNSTVRSRVIEVPILNTEKGANGTLLFRFKANAPYIYGANGSYAVFGMPIKEEQIPNWIDVDVEDVFTVLDENRYFSTESSIVFCLGKSVADRRLEEVR